MHLNELSQSTANLRQPNPALEQKILGTVGTSSPLYKIEKAARMVALESSNQDEALEEVDTLIGLIFNAEGDAYSSLWVPTGGGTDASFWLTKSKKEAAKAR